MSSTVSASTCGPRSPRTACSTTALAASNAALPPSIQCQAHNCRRGHGDDVSQDRVVGAGQPGDRVEFPRVNLAVPEKTVSDLKHQDLGDHDAVARLAELDRRMEPALEQRQAHWPDAES